jgi:CRISPR-associated protein Cmr6
MADYPLPMDTMRAFRAAERGCRNFGLLYDCFVGYGPDWSMEGNQKYQEVARLVEAANRWAGDAAYQAMYQAVRERWQRIMVTNGAESFTASPEWRLVVGLGRDSAFETGLTLHRVYGFPYVPGSALKGMTQAWAEASGEIKKPEIETVFGQPEKAGTAVFFDALPVSPPRLELDVINPHYPDYYRPGSRLPPADWQSPVPVYFITVAAGTEFLFGVGVRSSATDKAALVRTWLQRALQEIGVGGKTSSGYGYWEV